MKTQLQKLRPLIKWAQFEKMAGIPKNTFGKHFHHAEGGKHGIALPEQHKPAIRKAARELAEMLLALSE